MSHNDHQSQHPPLREIVSHNLSYKAVVYDRGDETSPAFEVAVYTWKDEDALEMPVWKRVGGPFVLDTLDAAERTARNNLHLLSGEIPDTTVDESLAHLIREVSDDEHAEFLDIKNYTVTFLESETPLEIHATKIAVVHDLYIVESGHRWLLGSLMEDGVIECWIAFESIEEVLGEIGENQ